MTEAELLLEVIEQAVTEHGGDLGGGTRRTNGHLQLFDGRVTLRADAEEADPARPGAAHAHVFTTVHEYDNEVLDACVFGMGNDRHAALREASLIWLTAVAGPIKSFLDNK